MSIAEKLKAKNNFIIVLRDEADDETGSGIGIPEEMRIKPQTGKVLSVGKLVQDRTIKVGDTLVFNKTAGFILEFTGEDVLVLKDIDALASL